MAQATQIVPKFSFPYVETIINDYTQVTDDNVQDTVENDVKQAYAVIARKGIDGVWVRKSSRESGVKTFGESNFKKFGQPLMQALSVLAQDDSQVWIMRVMPENATYANGIVSAYFKADTAEDVADAHKRKFRVKLTSKAFENISTKTAFNEAAQTFDGATVLVDGEKVYKDAEGYQQAQILAVRCNGRGDCGNLNSVRISHAASYEKEYGITMYNFEVLNSEAGLTNESNYVGALTTSAKYGVESTTLIDDILDDAEVGLAPIDVRANEENVEVVYDAYIAFCKSLHADLMDEYEAKVVAYAIPEDMLNGTAVVTDAYLDHYNELLEIDAMIEATADSELPDLDQFDLIFGLKVDSTETLPGFYYPELLTADVDISDPDYNAADYTANTDLVDFSSVNGLRLTNGTNGYFDAPRTVIENGIERAYTFDDEVEDCYMKAYNGSYDKKILSPKRIALTALWDANYSFPVKETLANLALVRNDARVYLDCGIIESLNISSLKTMIRKYAIFDDKLESVDIHNYYIKESATNKKVRVTISYFLAQRYVYHINNIGYHVPFVKDYAQLAGHVKDSLCPVVEEYDTDIKELLYNNRLNYFECVSENVFQRAVQNTRQIENSDLLEESNTTILYKLKRDIEDDVRGQLYNFADESVRATFINTEKAKYAPIIGTILESFDISFKTSEYEFNRSILHAYVAIVFRGLNKRCIVEIDINKRTYTAAETE